MNQRPLLPDTLQNLRSFEHQQFSLYTAIYISQSKQNFS
jgi:hypothetical protein